jgi:hypothetical protein
MTRRMTTDDAGRSPRPPWKQRAVAAVLLVAGAAATIGAVAVLWDQQPVALRCGATDCELTVQSALGDRQQHHFDGRSITGAQVVVRPAQGKAPAQWGVVVEFTGSQSWAHHLQDLASSRRSATLADRAVDAWLASGRRSELVLDGPGPSVGWPLAGLVFGFFLALAGAGVWVTVFEDPTGGPTTSVATTPPAS